MPWIFEGQLPILTWGHSLQKSLDIIQNDLAIGIINQTFTIQKLGDMQKQLYKWFRC